MLRSMFSGVSGLRSHQIFMDVVGNNIANVNTTGFKASAVIFQDLLSQTLNGAGSAALGSAGGTNPAQVGLGVRIAGIGTTFNQGAAQYTGRSTDFAIQGDGFFLVQQSGQRLYTRAGSFILDGLGQLVTPEGGVIQGWAADTAGTVNTNANVGSIRIPVGQTLAPSVTTKVRIGGNLPADAATATVVNTSITAYDSLGAAVPVRVEFTKAAGNTWTVAAYSGSTALTLSGTSLVFDTAGARTTPAPPANLTITGGWPASANITGAVTLDMGVATEPDRLTGFAQQNSAAATSQNGSAIGSLQSFGISQEGLITGVFSNGRNQSLGQVALAVFANPTGLEKAGSSMYRESVNSGVAQVGVAGGGGRGLLSGGTLEMSNVDLAQEFTNLIIAQRGFQANSRIISASDEILQDLVNLKR